MRRIIAQASNEEVAKVARLTLLNEIGNYMTLCSRVIGDLSREFERMIRQLPHVEYNLDKFYNDSEKLADKIMSVLKEYKDSSKEPWSSFAMMLAVLAIADFVLEHNGDKILESVYEYVQAELGGVEQ